MGVLRNSEMTIKGIFRGGTASGLCRVNHRNGDIYHGFLKENKMNGIGCYYKKSRNRWCYGMFDDSTIKIIKSGNGYPIELIGKPKPIYTAHYFIS